MMPDLKLIAEQTRDWLQHHPAERFTPEHFFGMAWLRHKIVSIGERHDEAPQRDFVACKSPWKEYCDGLILFFTA